jgi:hypothetical protein
MKSIINTMGVLETRPNLYIPCIAREWFKIMLEIYKDLRLSQKVVYKELLVHNVLEKDDEMMLFKN